MIGDPRCPNCGGPAHHICNVSATQTVPREMDIPAILARLEESDLRQREVLARQADLERRVAAIEGGRRHSFNCSACGQDTADGHCCAGTPQTQTERFVKDEAVPAPLVDRMAKAIYNTEDDCACRFGEPCVVQCWKDEARAALDVARADLLAEPTDAEAEIAWRAFRDSDKPAVFNQVRAALSAFLASRRQR